MTIKLQRVAVGLVLALVVVYLLICLRRGNDFWTFHDIGLFAIQRADIYGPSPTTGMYVFYLPYFALLMMPFAVLPMNLAAAVWFFLKIAGLFWLYRYMREKLDSDRQKSFWIALVPMLLLINPLNSDFRLGQVNLFVHLALIGAYVALSHSRRFLASFLFSLACIKVTPLIFLGFFVLKREFRFLSYSFIWMIVLLGLLSLWYGNVGIAELLVNWWGVSSKEKLNLSALGYFENQAFLGLFARLEQSFPDLPIFSGTVQFGTVVLPAFKAWAYGLSGVCIGLAIAPVLLLNRSSRWDTLGWSVLYGLFFIVMLLASPDTRNAHLIHLLFPFFILWQLVQSKSDFASLSKIALAVGSLGLILTSRDIVGKALNQSLREYSHQTLILTVIFVILAVIQVRYALIRKNISRQ